MIELQDVTRTYGAKVAVDRLSLSIAPGELFAFLGPNGAGKTTTIKMLVSLLRPTSGRVTLGGVDVVRDPQAANRMSGYVPDEPYLYDKLSGREFLQFIGEMYGIRGEEAAAAMEAQIEAFELSPFVDYLAESYSHGMKQRLVFASALLHNPAILFVDEPMVGLDPRSIRMVKDLLRRKTRDGTTVFMSTHTLSVAEEIADRIGVIYGGKLLFLGEVDELREQLALEDEAFRNTTLEQLFLKLTEPA